MALCIKPLEKPQVASQDYYMMENCRDPEIVPSSAGGTSMMSSPLFSDESDSVLTAARMARRGWTEDKENKKWQFSYSNKSPSQTSVPISDGNKQVQIRVEVCAQDSRSKQAPISNSRTMAVEKDTCFERRAEEEKQTCLAAFLANRQNNINTLREKQRIICTQRGVIYVWTSGCRTKSRPSRRLKSPMLPVIAEI